MNFIIKLGISCAFILSTQGGFAGENCNHDHSKSSHNSVNIESNEVQSSRKADVSTKPKRSGVDQLRSQSQRYFDSHNRQGASSESK